MDKSTTIHASQFVVASVSRLTGVFSMANLPHIHEEYKDALHEAQRLASKDPSRKFLVLAVAAVSQTDEYPVTTTYSLY